MWSFNKKQTAKKVDEKVQEEDLNFPEEITIYSRSGQIINGKCFIKSQVDARDLERMMQLVHKETKINLKVATKFDNIKVHSITLQSSNDFLMGIHFPKSQYIQVGQKCTDLLWSDND